MDRCLRFAVATLIAVVALSVPWSGALAQGVTGSAITGTVNKEGGAGPIEGVSLRLRNPSTGDTFTAVSGSSGRYSFDNLPPGGPYVLTATVEGYQASTQPDIQLSLGQRLKNDVVMHRELVEEIAVTAPRADANADKERTGPSTTLKNAQIVELPLQGRNFTSLIATDPRVTSQGDGISIAGQNSRFNNIQIDGGAYNDLFGLAGNGTPGGNSGAKPLSLEAVQEFVVQVAPFDVRQGNFAGGLVNAITKSGTNDFHGGLFGYYQSLGLTNENAFINGVYQRDPNYHAYYTTQYGAFVGGPIIKDQLHFFIATDIQARQASSGSSLYLTGDPVADKARVGFTADDVKRFTDLLQTKYGISNAGDASTPNQGNPNHNLFVKVTSNQIPDSRLELSYNWVTANQDVLSRDYSATSVPFFLSGGYQLSNSGYGISNTTNTGRVKLTTNWEDGKYSNEFITGFSIVRDARSLANGAPLILVKTGTVAGTDAYLAAGAERFSQGNALDQNVYQLQDNLTLAAGDQHRITFGTSNEFLHFRNLFLQAKIGAWAFDCLNAADCPNSFEAGQPSAYQRRFGLSPLEEAGISIFDVQQLGFYVQDEYTPIENVALTGGVRVDIPFVGKGITNPTILNTSPVAIDTGKSPSGNPLWSPRLGVNWDVLGNADTIVRGGVGLFAGPPPYVWVANMYSINGLGQLQRTCAPTIGNGNVPTFTPDPNAQPTDCQGGTGIPAVPPGKNEIDYFDPSTRYPQNLRFSLGADERLPWWGLLASVDLLYTRDVNGWYTTDANLIPAGTDGDGRALYGDFNKSTPTKFTATPHQIDPVNISNAVEVYNKNGGKAYSATIQLQKPFARRFAISVAYTLSRSVDRISFTSSQALSNYRFEPVDGSLDNRSVTLSAFDRTHKITITGTAAVPLGPAGVLGVGLSYIGQSGTPYTWVVNGDVNGDGQTTNDLPLIPATASQISLSGTPAQQAAQYAALDNFINSQSCLRDARGALLQRGACRNPWNDFFDLRLSWTSPNWKGQHFEVQYDIFNVLNLLKSNWGHFNQVTPFDTANTQFLKAVGYDAANRRPIYSYTPLTSADSLYNPTQYSPTQSRWRMQLGARYIF